MAEQEIIKLFRRVETLKTETGAGDNAIDKQSEIFRLFGMIEWILKIEGNWILEEMEDDVLAARIQDSLQQAREQLKRTAIGPTPTGNLPRAADENEEDIASFPKYFELPALLVREKILSFLSPEDLLNVALVKPMEKKFFPERITFLQMRTIFPILMEKNLLKPKDVMILSTWHPCVRSIILKYYEDVIWKDGFRLFRCYHNIDKSVTLKNLIGLEEDYPVVSHVRFELNHTLANDSRRLEQLRICGKRILHCALKLNGGGQIMERIASYLERMPNLKTLSIEDSGLVQQETEGLVLPELPFLRNLALLESYEGSALQRMLLRKYGQKLEFVDLYTTGEPQVLFQIPGTHASVTSLKLGIKPFFPVPIRNVFNNLRTFGNCPLKKIDLRTGDIIFRPLLTLLGRHWAETLEVLEIRLPEFNARNHANDDENHRDRTWMTNLTFPKLRCLTTDCYPVSRNWSFLLLFPALEELTFYEMGDDEDGSMSDDDEQEEGTQPIVQLQSGRDAVLSSNIWKLFPKLEKVTFDVNGIESVTRKECMAAQMEM